MNPLMPVFKSKWFWIIVVVLLAIWLLGPKVKAFIHRLRTPDLGNYQGQSAPNSADVARIQALAAELRQELYNFIGWDNREEVAAKVLAMNDTEIKYLANYWPQITQGNTLLADVQDEWSWTGPNKQKLIAKLLQLNA